MIFLPGKEKKFYCFRRTLKLKLMVESAKNHFTHTSNQVMTKFPESTFWIYYLNMQGMKTAIIISAASIKSIKTIKSKDLEVFLNCI